MVIHALLDIHLVNMVRLVIVIAEKHVEKIKISSAVEDGETVSGRLPKMIRKILTRKILKKEDQNTLVVSWTKVIEIFPR
jgi:hypothetical protein